MAGAQDTGILYADLQTFQPVSRRLGARPLVEGKQMQGLLGGQRRLISPVPKSFSPFNLHPPLMFLDSPNEKLVKLFQLER